MTACPKTLPPWFADFTRWRDHGGLPAERPRTIPRAAALRFPWLYACYAERRPKPVPQQDYGLLAQSGVFIREPTGGNETEKVPAIKAAGFRYIAVNCIDYEPERWKAWRILASQSNVPVLPWGRCLIPSHVGRLVAIAKDWGVAGVALNVEDEAESTLPPEGLRALLDFLGWSWSVAIVTDYRGWMDASGYHGPSWACLADRGTCIQECFTNADEPRPLGDCYQRARFQGWRSYVPLLDTKLDPTAYTLQSAALTGPRALYVGDIVDAKDYARWAA